MSTAENALPDPTAAYNHLFGDVHARVFFGKLASYGIQPTTEKEAEDLLQIAGQLRTADSPTKQAADSSRFGSAVSALTNVLAPAPTTAHQQRAIADHTIKQAAAELMQDPSIYNSVLSLKAHEAALLAGAN